ncbi:hypothetical protein OW515_25710 [Klebsiella pneumoniae]
MRQERLLRIRAFRQALENAARMQPAKLRDESRWCELRQFPGGSCDLASNGLAQYLMESEGCHPCIIFMHGNGDFHIAENSTVHAHVIVLLDGEYIDLTLDQFDEYPGYVPYEPVESDGQIGKLLRNIMKHEGPVKTRKVNGNYLCVVTGLCRFHTGCRSGVAGFGTIRGRGKGNSREIVPVSV